MTDNWITRSLKAKAATWSSRAKMAQQAGNEVLLQKALKHKTRYEKELAEIEELDSPSADVPSNVKGAEPGCASCSLLKEVSFMQEGVSVIQLLNGSAKQQIRRGMRALGLTDADLQGMEQDLTNHINELSVCDKCRDQRHRLLTNLQWIRDPTQ
jgi:hypothetical protein